MLLSMQITISPRIDSLLTFLSKSYFDKFKILPMLSEYCLSHLANQLLYGSQKNLKAFLKFAFTKKL